MPSRREHGTLAVLMRVYKNTQAAAAAVLHHTVFLPDTDKARLSFWEGADSATGIKRKRLAHTRVLWAGLDLWSGRGESPSTQELLPNLRTAAIGTGSLWEPAIRYCQLPRYDHIEHLLLIRQAPMDWAPGLGLMPLEILSTGQAFPRIKRLTVWQKPCAAEGLSDAMKDWELSQYPEAWRKTLERIEVWPGTRWTSADTNIGSRPEGPYHNGNSPLQWLPGALDLFKPDLELVSKMPVSIGACEQEEGENADALHIFQVARRRLAQAWAQKVSAYLVHVPLCANIRVGVIGPAQDGFVTDPVELGRTISMEDKALGRFRLVQAWCEGDGGSSLLLGTVARGQSLSVWG